MENVEKQIAEMAANVKTITERAEKAGGEVKELAEKLEAKFRDADKSSEEKINALKQEMQKQFDELVTISKKNDKPETKTINEAIVEHLDGNMGQFLKELERSGKYKIALPNVKFMTLGNSLTGDSVVTYSPKNAFIPAQKVNFRDLVSTVNSDTGVYVFYSEDTGATNNIGVQTEGSIKGENQYDLTEVKVVNDYIAGFSRFSKQMLKSLPFMSQSLPRMLQRDFFKKENSTFFGVVSAAATGSTTTTATDDVEQLIQLIANQKASDFNASVAIVSPQQMARLIISTYTKGYYPGAGSVQMAGSSLVIHGTPVVEASWCTDDKVLILDSDYIERVQLEGVNITLSYEDSDNFQRNLVTARIECYEEINLMRADSAIYADLGNV